MVKLRAPKTYEYLFQKYFKQYQNLAQFRKRLESIPPTLTLDDLRIKARARALQAMHDEQLIATQGVFDPEADLESDAEFRDTRMDEYERVYGEWDDAGDRALLINLVELETQFRAIRRDLSRAINLPDKEKYWKALRENGEAQKNLQVTLGIDKKSREQARISGNPMDEWREIKDEIGDWVDMLMAEFVEESAKAKTEEDLRDLMKVKLSWPLAIVDAVVYNVKRVNEMLQEDQG